MIMSSFGRYVSQTAHDHERASGVGEATVEARRGWWRWRPKVVVAVAVVAGSGGGGGRRRSRERAVFFAGSG